MIVVLVLWLVILTTGIGVGFLMVVGKFARMQKDINEHESQLFTDAGDSEIGVLHGVFDALLNDFQNLKTSFENLPKTSETPEIVLEVLQKFANIETRIANLQETQKGLRGDIDLLFKADDEHPVTAVIGANKSRGGRPKKEGS